MPKVREECALICEDFLDRVGELQDAEQDNVDIVMYFLGRNYPVQQDAPAYFSCSNANVFGAFC